MNLFNKILLFISFISTSFLNAIITDFKLENKTNYRMYVSFGTSANSPLGMNFFPLFPKEPYTQKLTLGSNDYVWVLLSKEVPTSGKTKVLSVKFAPNKKSISVIVKNSTKNPTSGLEVSSASIIGGSNVIEQKDITYIYEPSKGYQDFQARLKKEQEALKKEEELKKALQEQEKARKAEAEAKRRAEREAADRKAAEAARIKAEQEKKRKAEEYEKEADEIVRRAEERARKSVENEFNTLGLNVNAAEDRIKNKYQQLLNSAVSEEQKKQITDAYNKIQRKLGFN